MTDKDLVSGLYFKKLVKFKHEDLNFNFKVSQSLFSSYNIDNGTQRLLRCLKSEDLVNCKKILDLGCGYGPLGIVLKTLNKKMDVHMVDRDVLALMFSVENSKINGVPDVNVYGSLDYSDVSDRDFDLIVSNIPAKVGVKTLSRMISGGADYLSEEGIMMIVVIDAIYEQVEKILLESNVSILLHKKWPGHHVLKYKFNELKKDDASKRADWADKSYDRGLVEISLSHSVNFSIQTTYNLSEFDTPSFDTQLLLSNLSVLSKVKLNRVLFFNPNHGYLPVAVFKFKSFSDVVLEGRNLQELRTSKVNLINNGYSSDIVLSHQMEVCEEGGSVFDVVVGAVIEKEGAEVLKSLTDKLVFSVKGGGIALLSSSSKTISALEKLIRKTKKFLILKKEKLRGRMFIAIKKN